MRGVCAAVCLGALLALAACDSDRPESEGQPQPAPDVQPAVQPEPPALPAPSEPAAAPSPAAEPQPAPEVITQPPAQPKPAAPASPPAAPKPAVPSQPVAPVAPQPLTEPEPAPAAARPPLDLSLPSAVDEVFPLPDAALSVPGVGEETPGGLLPPLFKTEEERQSSFELGGRLITTEHPEEDGEGYWDSVEGAELQLRFRR